MSRDRSNAAMAKSPTVLAGTGSGAPPATKPRLLLVDDEPQVLEGLALHLRRNYEVVLRTSGQDALRTLDREPDFTAVISDLRMPGMSGVELLAEIRQRTPETARVLLTGYADVCSAMAAVNDAAVHRFLTKPCAPAHLARALEEAVAASTAGPYGSIDKHTAALGRQATLGTMAGSIGQEISQVVAALAGSIDTIQMQASRGEVPASEEMGILAMIKNRLHQHTRTLQELSLPRPTRVGPIDVGTMVCSAVELMKKTGTLKVAKTEIVLPFSPLLVEADRSLLEGVMINLLKNAAEAIAERGAPDGPIDVDDLPRMVGEVAPQGEDAVTIAVEDNGVGMIPEQLGRLFQRYFTTKASSGGTGLGLLIAKETVCRHGGRIDAASIRGVGTRVVIELPLSGWSSPRARQVRKELAAEVKGGSAVRLAPRR